MALEVGGKTIETTENGHLVNLEDWTEEVGAAIAKEEGIEIFYFSSFDEDWKVGAEGDVGAYWGLWDKDGKLKYA